MTTTNVEVRCKNGLKTKSNPFAILDYNLNKTGVDKADQIIYYHLMKKKQQVVEETFVFMFVIEIVNACIL